MYVNLEDTWECVSQATDTNKWLAGWRGTGRAFKRCGREDACIQQAFH